jgi:hypothetical protein
MTLLGGSPQTCDQKTLTLWIVGSAMALVLLLTEYWLGKTDRVRANSIIELILAGATAVILAVSLAWAAWRWKHKKILGGVK